MSSLESWEACAARLTQLGFVVEPLTDLTDEGRQHHAANIATWQQALADARGAQGRSIEATKARLRTAISMERNLRERRLSVGMSRCTKRAM